MLGCGGHRCTRARRPRRRSTTAAARCTPLPRRLPDRCDHRAGGGRRAPVPLVAPPGGRLVPARAPRGARRPHLRLRRVPGGVPAEPAGARAPADGGRDDVGRLLGAARSRRRRRCSRAAGRWYIPKREVRYVRRNALVVLGQRRRPGRSRRRRRSSSATSPTTIRCCGATPSGRRGGSDARICSRPSSWRRDRSVARRARRTAAMTHLFVTNDFPPKVGGIQTMLWELWRRLDPSTLHGAHHALRRRPRLGRRPALPRGAHPREGPAALALARPADRRARRRRWARSCVVLDPALPVGLVGPRLRSPVRGGPARSGGHGARPAARTRTSSSATCSEAPGW